MKATSARSWLAVVAVGLVFLTLAPRNAAAARAVDEDEEETASGDRDFRFDFSLFGGLHFFSEDHGLGRDKGDPKGMSPARNGVFGARLGLNFNRWVTLEGEGSAIRTKTVNRAADMWIFQYRASLLVHLASSYAFRPFLLAGYGGMSSVLNKDTDVGVAAVPTIPPADFDGFIHAGLGFKIGFGDRAGLRLEGRIMFPGAILGSAIPIGDEIGYGGPDFEALGSFFIHFGEVERSRLIVKKEVTVVTPPTRNDPDGDGVSAPADKCPDVPEDRDGFEDEDGCPEPDNDKDGFPDVRDKCPNDPEDKDGHQDDDGCPEPDNDADGVNDDKDRCPNDPEDKDGFQDDDGCPEPDNDQDGVLDARDKCPNEPETKNRFQDEDGCPDEVPAEVKRFTGVIEGINFKTGSAEILPGSYPLLDRAVKVLQDYPDVMLEISGHTDSRGRADMNRDLSHRRGESVKQYFIARGIDPKRVAAIGYGMDRPVASNRTESGRARNRRIEFRLSGGEK